MQEVVKAIYTKRYMIELVQKEDSYAIYYDNTTTKESHISENIKDYGIASKLFDMKLQEFEGN